MATIFEMTGDDREQRIAELKQKMQQSAKRTQAEAAAEHSEESVSNTETATEPETATTDVSNDITNDGTTDEGTTESVAETETASATVESTPSAAAPATAAPDTVAEVQAAPIEEEDDGQAALTRREFLTYAWGAALGLLTVETALVSYFFMYPRFRAGEFGGKFFLAPTDVPSTDAAPAPEVAGKFWLVNTDEGPKALYMVCTHLGCLYKWEASNNRFECPCHGSKFSKAGYYIEGPAPRSLDTFELTEENGQIVVDTGAKATGNPAADSPARAVVS